MNLRKQLEKAFAKKPEVNGSIQGERSLKKPAPDMSTHHFPSTKAGCNIPVEGDLEHAAVISLEALRGVLDIRSQAINNQLDASHWSIPDFAVKTTSDAFKILEIKPSKTALTAEQQDRFFAAEQLYSREGIGFQLLDQTELPDEHTKLKLLDLYFRGHRTRWCAYTKELALDILDLDTYPTLSHMHKILAEEKLPTLLAEYFVFHQLKKTLKTNCLFTRILMLEENFI